MWYNKTEFAGGSNMKNYRMTSTIEPINVHDIRDEDRSIISVCTREELENVAENIFRDDVRLLVRYERDRFCKADEVTGYLFGSFSVPKKKEEMEYRNFMFCIHSQGILFVDDADTVEGLIRKISLTVTFEQPNVGRFLYSLMIALIQDDLYYLNSVQDKLADIEDEILEERGENYSEGIMHCRKEVLTFRSYYAQLTDMVEDLQENENGFFDERSIELFGRFADRVSRLLSETERLREYCLQVHEVYQSQIDLRQNKIMRILTVVTTVFAPLTLLTGWYGMNFTNMPELQWRYGYVLVIFISITIRAVCLMIFKRKRFL